MYYIDDYTTQKLKSPCISYSDSQTQLYIKVTWGEFLNYNSLSIPLELIDVQWGQEICTFNKSLKWSGKADISKETNVGVPWWPSG